MANVVSEKVEIKEISTTPLLVEGGKARGKKSSRGPKNKKNKGKKRSKKDKFPARQPVLNGYEADYGLTVAVDYANVSGDRDIHLEITPSQAWMMHLCSAVIAVMLNEAGLIIKDSNTYHMARFLCDQIVCAWTGRIPNHRLQRLPKIVWDIMDAGKPKLYGKYNFHMKDVDVASWYNQAHTTGAWGYPLGKTYASSPVGGFWDIDTSAGTYNEATTFENLRDLISAVAVPFGCVTRKEYRVHVPDWDCSFYAFLGNGPPTTADMWQFQYRANNVNHMCFVEASLPVPIFTPWLARVSVNDNPYQVPRGAILTRLCAPSGIVWQRMYYRWGYDEFKDWQVTYRWYSVKEFAKMWDNLFYEVITTAAKAITDFTVLIAWFDFKVFILMILSRWCRSWAGAAAGVMRMSSDGTSAFAAFMGVGHANLEQANTLLNFQILEEALSRVMPNLNNTSDTGKKKDKRKEIILPIPIFDEDYIFSESPNNWPESGNFFTAAINYFTEKVGTTEVAWTYGSIQQASTTIQYWNLMMERIAAYAPVSLRREQSPNSFTSITVYRKGTYANIKEAVTLGSVQKIDDARQPFVYGTLLPHLLLYASNGIHQSIFYYAGSNHFVDFAETEYFDLVASYMFITAHLPQAFGNPEQAPRIGDVVIAPYRKVPFHGGVGSYSGHAKLDANNNNSQVGTLVSEVGRIMKGIDHEAVLKNAREKYDEGTVSQLLKTYGYDAAIMVLYGLLNRQFV